MSAILLLDGNLLFIVCSFLFSSSYAYSFTYIELFVCLFFLFLVIPSVCLLCAPSCFPGLSLPPSWAIYFLIVPGLALTLGGLSSNWFASHFVLRCSYYIYTVYIYLHCPHYQVLPRSPDLLLGSVAWYLFPPIVLFISPVRGFTVTN